MPLDTCSNILTYGHALATGRANPTSILPAQPRQATACAPSALRRNGFGGRGATQRSGISTIRFAQSSSCDAVQIKHEILNDRGQRRVLLDEEHAGTRTSSREKFGKVPRHRSEVVRDENAILCAASASTSGSLIASSFPVRAERKSIAGSRRTQPVTMA